MVYKYSLYVYRDSVAAISKMTFVSGKEPDSSFFYFLKWQHNGVANLGGEEPDGGLDLGLRHHFYSLPFHDWWSAEWWAACFRPLTLISQPKKKKKRSKAKEGKGSRPTPPRSRPPISFSKTNLSKREQTTLSGKIYINIYEKIQCEKWVRKPGLCTFSVLVFE